MRKKKKRQIVKLSLQSSQSRTAKTKACRDSRDNRFGVSQSKCYVFHLVLPTHREILMVCMLVFQAACPQCQLRPGALSIQTVSIIIYPFSKNLGSPTLLPSYCLQQEAATSLNKYLFVQLCLHFMYKYFLSCLFFPSSKSFIADVV